MIMVRAAALSAQNRTKRARAGPARSTDDPAVRWLLSTTEEAARELLPGFR